MTAGGDNQEDREGVSGLPQDPIVRSLRPDPALPPEAFLTLSGFLGDSDREGCRRLYLTRDLTYFAEFRAEDVLRVSAVPADQPPFLGDEGTQVTIRRDATISYTRTRTGRPIDEFDLNMRLASADLQKKAPDMADGTLVTYGCFSCPDSITCGTPNTCIASSCHPLV
jgi:hypothetical protein